MPIRHHLSDALLLAYSAGQLPEAFSLVVSTHVSLCDECRARLFAFDAIGGALIEAPDEGDLFMPDSAMSDSRMAAAIDLITAAPQLCRNKLAPRHAPGAIFPAPLRDAVGGDLASVRWRPIGMGVRQAILPAQGKATVRLLSIPAGQAVPDHGHRGTELTLVLQGAFRDQTDRFVRGDVEIATEELEHTPVAEAGADCICLAATDAPLRFNALMPRIAQPFFRI